MNPVDSSLDYLSSDMHSQNTRKEVALEDIMTEIREIEHSLKALTNLKTTVETQAQKIKQLERAAMKQRHVIRQQQRFLQLVAGKKSEEENLILTGIEETGDDNKNYDAVANEIVSHMLPDIEGPIEMEIQRIGDPLKAQKPRPMLVRLKDANLRYRVCKNANDHQFIEGKVLVRKRRDTSGGGRGYQNDRIRSICSSYYGPKGGLHSVKKTKLFRDHVRPAPSL